MQLFTFGHPCEHQLRRVCIGGTSCPLNGYPDHWCCSFVKGRINFKRDKPCEGARCRWGFAHPPVASFDAVTLVLQEGRACAVKMEENYGTGTLHGGPYLITSPHPADVAHCALNFLRVPPVRVATRVGGLLAFAAVKAGDAKAFTQLLKTMKKPVDDYLIGAFEYLQSSKGSKPKLDTAVMEDLRHDIIAIMGSALSHGGELTHRAEQLPLQTYYIAALKTATRNKKKHAESLDKASSMFTKAVEAGAQVPPESWTKSLTAPAREGGGSTTRRDSTAASSAGSDGGAGHTPEHKPATPPSPAAPATKAQAHPPPAETSSSKATPPQAPAASASGKVASAGATAPSPAPEPNRSTAAAKTDVKPAAAAVPAASAPAAAASTAPSTAATPAKADLPSLFAACQELGQRIGPAPPEAQPVIFTTLAPPAEPCRLVFGGLFSLDVNQARGALGSAISSGDSTPRAGHGVIGGGDHASHFSSGGRASSTVLAAPLGQALLDSHTLALWPARGSSRSAEAAAAERKADLEAAAAALAAADVVLASLA